MDNPDCTFALSGTRIVDMTTGIAGPYSTLLLAGLGADVLKIEPLEGDPARGLPPFTKTRTGGEISLTFLHLNRGSRSVVLDPTQELDRSQFRNLITTADVLILDGPIEEALAPWDIAPGYFRASHRRLVIASLVAFGGPGPWSKWDAPEIVFSAATGLASCTGESHRSPLKVGGHVCQVAHGQTVAVAALTALLDARRTGHGTDVEISGAEANADLLEMWAAGAYQGRPMPRQGRNHNANYPFEVYPCADGLVGVHAGPGSWEGFERLVDSEELRQIDVSGHETDRMHLREQIDPIIVDWLSGRQKIQTYHDGQARRQAFGYVATVEDLVHSPQLAERDFFRRIDHPEVEKSGLYVGPPFRLASGWQDHRAPLLGEHTEEVLEELRTGTRSVPTSAIENDDTVKQLPLHGIRVLDLTQIWAGPRATKVLTDYGADVIKIEPSTRTDSTRSYGKYLALGRDGQGIDEREFYRQTQFEQLHRGQRSVTLNLKSEIDKKAFDQLVASSDVVIANFAYGVLSRLGIDWPDLERINSRIILLSMTGFGDSGPERDYVGYGVTQEQLSGIYGLTGYKDDEPLKSGSNIGDPMNGMHGAVAILAALLEREETGKGQYIELSQLESTVPFIGEIILDYGFNSHVAKPLGNTHEIWAPHGIYPALGEDCWIAIVARDDDEWSALLDTLGGQKLYEDARFLRVQDRLSNRKELDVVIGELTSRWDREELAIKLQNVGVPAAPVLDSFEVQHHKHYAATNYIQVRDYPGGGTYRYFGPLWRINGSRPEIRGSAPLLGAHNREVLKQLTTLKPEEIEAGLG